MDVSGQERETASVLPDSERAEYPSSQPSLNSPSPPPSRQAPRPAFEGLAPDLTRPRQPAPSAVHPEAKDTRPCKAIFFFNKKDHELCK